MSRISPGPLGVSCQPKKCDSYSLLRASAAPRSQESMHLELTVLNVHTSAPYTYGAASSFCITDTTAEPVPVWQSKWRERPVGSDGWRGPTECFHTTQAFPTLSCLLLVWTCIEYMLSVKGNLFFFFFLLKTAALGMVHDLQGPFL